MEINVFALAVMAWTPVSIKLRFLKFQSAQQFPIQRLLAHHDHHVKSNVSQLFKNLQIHLSRIADQMAHLTLFSAKV